MIIRSRTEKSRKEVSAAWLRIALEASPERRQQAIDDWLGWATPGEVRKNWGLLGTDRPLPPFARR